MPFRDSSKCPNGTARTYVVIVASAAMSNPTKQIPVTEERWNELTDLKPPGKTYDALLAELIREHHRHSLADSIRHVREVDTDELTPLDELS